MAIPASAETEYEAVTITYEDLFNMFINGDLHATFHFSNSLGQNIQFYQTNSSGININNNTSYAITSCTLIDDSAFFYLPYLTVNPFNSQSNTILFTYILDFPFPYVLQDTVFNLQVFFPSSDVSATLNINLLDDVGDTLYNFSDTPVSYLNVEWGDYQNDKILKLYYDLFYNASGPNNYITQALIPRGLRSNGNFFSLTCSSNSIADSISFNTSLFYYLPGSISSYYSSPVGFTLGSFTAYVPKESAPVVDEYLELLKDIAGSPTPENQQKINQLKQKFDSIDSDLEQSSQDMEVEIPDISNKLDTLPQEVVQGNNMVSTNIITPILNIPFVSTIFTALFAFLAIKLILHGGGKE